MSIFEKNQHFFLAKNICTHIYVLLKIVTPDYVFQKKRTEEDLCRENRLMIT